ncbi:MAG: hypothetical protein LBF70_02775 [Holosporales bacterium]|jgi:hypothetical protein|nr:hypothetical protein [Holosporales bacterium]
MTADIMINLTATSRFGISKKHIEKLPSSNPIKSIKKSSAERQRIIELSNPNARVYVFLDSGLVEKKTNIEHSIKIDFTYAKSR